MSQMRATYIDYCKLNDGRRYEVIAGELKLLASPSYIHQRISAELAVRLGSQLHGKPCALFYAPFDVRLPLTGEDGQSATNVVQPDLLILCDKSKLKGTGCLGAPDLVIEILSLSTARHDLVTKKALYERAGVREYWIVDPFNSAISQFIWSRNTEKFEDEVYLGVEERITVAILPEIVIPLNEIFLEEIITVVRTEEIDG